MSINVKSLKWDCCLLAITYDELQVCDWRDIDEKGADAMTVSNQHNRESSNHLTNVHLDRGDLVPQNT